MKKKILFILNTYNFQSNILNQKKNIEQNYNYFNTQDFVWSNYFFNNLKKDYLTFKDYPYLNKKILKNENYLEFLKKKILKINPDIIFSTMNDYKIDELLKTFKNIKKIIWISYRIDTLKLQKLKKSYNYLISSNEGVLHKAKKIKFKNFKMLISSPSFVKLKKEDFKIRKNEAIFTGSLGSDFKKRLDILLYLYKKFKITIRIRNLIEKHYLLNSFNYFLIKLFPNLANYLYKIKFLPITNKLKYINRDEVFGNLMFKELKKFRFCINIHSNFDENFNINARVYEALSCGCLLFTDDNETMKKYFLDNKHVVYFSSKEDLIKKLNYYSKNFQISYQIAKQGNQLLILKHLSKTRINKFKKILKVLLNEL